MPKNILPKPCPICEEKFGTISFQTFSNNVELICRIKHYDKEGYQKAKDRINSGNIDAFTAKSIKNNWQQKWCNFRTEHGFFYDERYRFENSSGVMDKWKCINCDLGGPYNYITRKQFYNCKNDGHRPSIIRKAGSKSKSFKITEEIKNIIKEKGWKAKPSSSRKYKGRHKIRAWEK